MADTQGSGLRMGELLSASLRVWRENARTFVLLMGAPILALLLTTTLVALFTAPMQPGEELRARWLAMETWRKATVTVLMLATFAVLYRLRMCGGNTYGFFG